MPSWTEYAHNPETVGERVRRIQIAQVPMKRCRTCTNVCKVAVLLASDQSSYITDLPINVTAGQEMR